MARDHHYTPGIVNAAQTQSSVRARSPRAISPARAAGVNASEAEVDARFDLLRAQGRARGLGGRRCGSEIQRLRAERQIVILDLGRPDLGNAVFQPDAGDPPRACECVDDALMALLPARSVKLRRSRAKAAPPLP